MPTDWNIRDVFTLFNGCCGHRWVAEYPDACPTCGDFDDGHITAREAIAVDIGYVWPKLVRRRARAVREGRRRPRKTAEVISLVERRSLH